MIFKLGVNSKAYRNSGSYATPVWDELTEVTELAVKADWDTQDVPRRGYRVKQKVKTLLDLGVTFKHLVIDKPATSDTSDYSALMDAFLTDGVLDVLVLNGPVATQGVRGFRFDAQVTGAGESQNPGDVLQDDMMFAPTVTGNAPQAVLVGAAGAVTFKSLTGDLTAAFA